MYSTFLGNVLLINKFSEKLLFRPMFVDAFKKAVLKIYISKCTNNVNWQLNWNENH